MVLIDSYVEVEYLRYLGCRGYDKEWECWLGFENEYEDGWVMEKGGSEG